MKLQKEGSSYTVNMYLEMEVDERAQAGLIPSNAISK